MSAIRFSTCEHCGWAIINEPDEYDSGVWYHWNHPHAGNNRFCLYMNHDAQRVIDGWASRKDKGPQAKPSKRIAQFAGHYSEEELQQLADRENRRSHSAKEPEDSSYTHPPVKKKLSPQRQLLLDAADTVDGERQDQYGNAEDSFATIAELWSSYINIGQPKKDWIDITAKDVAILMVLFKAAREGNSPKRDNLLDLAGYAALAQRIEES